MRRKGPKPVARTAWAMWREFSNGEWGWAIGFDLVPTLWRTRRGVLYHVKAVRRKQKLGAVSVFVRVVPLAPKGARRAGR